MVNFNELKVSLEVTPPDGVTNQKHKRLDSNSSLSAWEAESLTGLIYSIFISSLALIK